MQENRVSATISKEEKEAILKSLEDIKEKLPFLFALTVEERVRMVKLGQKVWTFIDATGKRFVRTFKKNGSTDQKN